MNNQQNEISIRDFAGKTVFFSGIGGCSMNGLARILHAKGYRVLGSDRSDSNYTQKLKRDGIQVTIGQREENVYGADLFVYTAAVKPDNPERAYATAQSIPQMDRATLLGQITREFRRVVGIAGCHGKTTITSMLALILEHGGVESTVHVGGDVAFLEGGTRVGRDSDLFVTEACEYVESFLKLSPTIEVINNIDDDHLDYYGDIDHIYAAFSRYTALLPDNGMIFGCADDPLVMRLLKESNKPYAAYGFGSEAQLRAENIVFSELGNPSFDCVLNGERLFSVSLNVPGMHNVMNALAAICVARHLGVSDGALLDALKGYTLTKRRFEDYGTVNGIHYFHDYAHHPSEIEACLNAAKHYPHNRIWCIFQCNSYSRGKTLFDKYARCFKDADFVLVPDIYPGREQDKGLIHARDLVRGIREAGKSCEYLPTFPDIRDYLKEHAREDDLVLGVGSGDVHLQLRTLME
ncbi:MAG: UDP-N-acetylmuramate--L-alanine ligase [Bacillota bacterium]